MLIFDLVPPAELNEFARALRFPEFNLAEFLPNRLVDDLDYRFYRGALRDEDVATFRSFDTEAPIAKRQANLTRVTGELPPIARKIMLGEEQRLRLRQLQRDGGQLQDGTNVPQDIIDQIFNDAANMTRAVQARVELARAEVLTTGKLNINENGLKALVDYAVPTTNFRTVTQQWDANDGDPIVELTAIVQEYRTKNGADPAFILTSTRAINSLLFNNKIRTYAATQVGGTPAMVSRQTLDQVFQVYNLPPLRAYDTSLRLNGAAVRLIPSHLAILVPGRADAAAAQAFETETGNVAQGSFLMGETLYGVTAEAIELGGAGQIETTDLPGITVVTMKTYDPIQTWTKAAGIAIPMIGNPDALFVLSVLDPE